MCAFGGFNKRNTSYISSRMTQNWQLQTLFETLHTFKHEVTRSEVCVWNTRTSCLRATVSDQWPDNGCRPCCCLKTQVECKYCSAQNGESIYNHDQPSFNKWQMTGAITYIPQY